jgi:hypothetical protein
MKAVSEAHGAKFLMIVWRWDKEDSLELFKGMELDMIDTLSSSPPEWKTMKNPWDGHPTPRANTHVAQLLLKYFADKAAQSRKE